ncbi:TRAP transporter small permease subunit [Alphaproteobacteria bacterium KMM 3653]|uniref:TRAP transporter small permease protein n=1 Tax=Harenicola maris TaxID=2841044 RepID=A0AAP2CV51_9RHOB|nr:TRAP transporter small permease subunit [Harenicola maris]
MPNLITPANRFLASVGTVLILLQMLLICSDIARRSLLSQPIPGVFEVIELTIVAIVFLQIPRAIETGSFIRSDGLFSFTQRRYPRLGRTMDFAFNTVGALVMAAIAYGVYFKLVQAIERNLFTGNPGIFTAPIWPALLCVVVGAVMASLSYVTVTYRHLKNPSLLTGEVRCDGH